MTKQEIKLLDSVQRKIGQRFESEKLLKLFELWTLELSQDDYSFLFRNINAIKKHLKKT